MTSRTISLIVATTAGAILLCTTAPVLLVGGIAAACITPTHTPPPAASTATPTIDLPTPGHTAWCATGWVRPLDGIVVSEFRTPQRPHHNGTDIAAAKGTPIHAAADAIAVRVACNAYTQHGRPYSCDIDGSPHIRGCGWYLDLRHPDDTLTRYCHLAAHPTVNQGDPVLAGQIIGHVGSSGNSSGPHLHLETHLNYPPTHTTAIDPREFFAIRGVDLG
jgi:murein DD-endopeptidase MepM/ murein hydrolase activator NlpD